VENDGRKDCFETDIPYAVIALIVQNQFANRTAWDVHSYGVTGGDSNA